MKGTDHFKRTIHMYLEQRAEEDALFAKKYRNPAKNMDECVTHILGRVDVYKRQGRNGENRSRKGRTCQVRASRQILLHLSLIPPHSLRE